MLIRMLSCALLFVSSVQAQTFSWLNASGGTFGTSTNWSPLGPPSTLSHTALFASPTSSYTVNLGANHTVGTLIVSQTFGTPTFNAPARQLTVGTLARFASNTAWNGGTLSISLFGGSLEVGASLNVGTGSYIRSGSILVGTPASSGQASFNASTFSIFGGSIGQGVPFTSSFSMTNGSVGTFAVLDVGAPGSSSAGSVSILTNSQLTVGTLQLGNQGTVATGSSMTVSGGARVTMAADSPLIVGGSTIEFLAGFPPALRRGGTLNITANSSTFTPGTPGTFSTSNAPVLVNYGGAINVGNGTFNVNGDVQCNGLISVSSAGSYLAGPSQTTRVDGESLSAGAIFPVASPSFSGTGTITGGTFIVGSASTANGWATLGPATTVNFAAAAIVGESGTGRLDAVTLNTPNLTVGALASGVGTFSAGFYDTGTVSTDRSGAPVVGSVIAGNLGTGVLQVRLGSTMTVNGPTDVGLGAGSAGTLRIEGAGEGSLATYAAPGQRMNVGSAGAGTLLVGPFSVLNVGTLVIGPLAGGGTGTGIQTGGTVTPSSGTLQVNPRGNYTLAGGTLGAAVNNLGTFTYAGGALGGSVANAGTLVLNAALPAGALVSNTSTGRMVGAGGLFAGNGTINNAGSFGGVGTVAAGMTLHNTGTLGSLGGDFVIENGVTFTNAAGSLIRNAQLSTLRLRTFLDNAGNVEVNAGGGVETAFSLNILAGQKLTLKGGLLSVGDSVVGDNLPIFPGATVVGFGQINASMYNAGSMQFNGPTQIVGLFQNDAAVNVRNATTIVYGPMTNNGSITVQNGTIIFEQAFARGRGDGSGGGGIAGTGITAVLPGGRLVADAVRQGTLELAGTSFDLARAAVRPAFAGGRTSVVRALAIAGSPGSYFGQLDLADTSLVIDYIGASPAGTVRDQLASGFAGGAWTGLGIASSAAAATTNRALGFAEAAQMFGSFPASFAGEPVDDTALLLRYTVYGDADLTGAVNLDDFTRLAACFGSGTVWSQGDFNYDGAVNLDDFTALAANFGLSLPTEPVRAREAVPEPTAVGLGALALGLTLCRRQRLMR